MVEAVDEAWDLFVIEPDMWTPIDRITAQGPDAVSIAQRANRRNEKKLGSPGHKYDKKNPGPISTLGKQRFKLAMSNGFHDQPEVPPKDEEGLDEIGSVSYTPHDTKIYDMVPLSVLDGLFCR